MMNECMITVKEAFYMPLLMTLIRLRDIDRGRYLERALNSDFFNRTSTGVVIYRFSTGKGIICVLQYCLFKRLGSCGS